ncbi:MAG: MnhB domain-containing protein [Planctomycetota bacterium]
MNSSVIFRTAAKTLLPLLVLFSVVVLLRGHNEPGGGFVGGLLVASAFALYSMAFGVEEARDMLRWPWGGRVKLQTVIGLGLIAALGSGVVGMLLGGAPFEAWWNGGGEGWDLSGLDLGTIKFGTVLLFDVGVYLTVLGVVLTFIFTLEESNA